MAGSYKLVVEVETAAEMAAAVWGIAPACDLAVLAAAVADFRPAGVEALKIKRQHGTPEIALEPTPDVLAGVVEMEEGPLVVGFAAETGPLDDAAVKAQQKGVDLLVANDVTKEGSGFGSDTNEVTLIDGTGAVTRLPFMTKTDVADALWSAALDLRT